MNNKMKNQIIIVILLNFLIADNKKNMLQYKMKF